MGGNPLLTHQEVAAAPAARRPCDPCWVWWWGPAAPPHWCWRASGWSRCWCLQRTDSIRLNVTHTRQRAEFICWNWNSRHTSQEIMKGMTQCTVGKYSIVFISCTTPGHMRLCSEWGEQVQSRMPSFSLYRHSCQLMIPSVFRSVQFKDLWSFPALILNHWRH